MDTEVTPPRERERERETQKTQPNPIESLSKDEIITKYKGLLNIAKKAKQAKDDLTEENRQLKEALRRAAEKQASLPAMQEMVQDFTDKNVILTEQVQALKRQTKTDAERLSHLEIENESLKRQLNRLTEENDGLLADVERMELAMQQVNALGTEQRKNLELLEEDIAKIKEAEIENTNLKQELSVTNQELNELKEKYEKVKQLNSEQRKKFNSLKDRFIEVHRKLKNLKECKCVLLETQHEYAASVSKWQAEIIRASQLLCGKMQALQEENEQLKNRLTSAKQNQNCGNESGKGEVADQLRLERWLVILNNAESLVNKVREEHQQQKHSHHNLSQVQEKLNRMQSILQTVSEERNQELRQYQNLESTSIELRQHHEDLLARYHLKEQEHAELLAEMRELNEALKGRGDMISRLQEQESQTAKSHKELEDNLAQCQQSLLEKSQKIDQLISRIDELEQANGIDNQSEVLSTSTISRAEELSRLRELDDGYEDKYNKLRAIAAKLKKKLQEQMQDLKKMEDVKEEVETIKLAQCQLQQDLNAARAENQKLKSKEKPSRNSNVLNLEIEAAEKSLADVSAKLNAKIQELDLAKESLASKENSLQQLRKEITLLEEAKNGEALHSKQLKEQIDHLQEQVKDAIHAKHLAITQNKELDCKLEQMKLEVEQLNLQLAESLQKNEEKLSKNQQMLTTKTEQMELHLEKLQQLELALRKSEQAQEDIRLEYTEYKVKAQAVLRKNQNKGSDKEQELYEEMVSLREKEKSLRASNDSKADRLAQFELQVETLQQDNANLQKRSKDFLNLVEELRQQNDILTLENQSQLKFQQELMQQHRQQMEESEAAHRLEKKQILELQSKQEELIRQVTAPTHDRTPPVRLAEGQESLPSSLEQSKIDYLLNDHMENSNAVTETSLAQLAAQRKISTASSRRSHDFMPLDELLNTSINQITSDTVTTISNFGRSVSMQNDDEESSAADYAAAQLLATKERLSIQESRVRHLTSLLAENEQDLAKLTQMNDMLKEELRRQERSEEREQHMHNSEYLKNVFLKFLTLNNTDERQRLIPVLNTILRLSRNEMEMLNCVAKGQRVSTDGNNRSWTGFLTAWSGGGGGGNNNNNNNSN
ncbi:GRIP and coiled-coil domain-containing protein 2 [Drosophila tropicalis]|uniref:GRIP and coiled-coil domain-containing protein 2 n=1 Tax=Drosophila tropicalis TaxID=46794 RepID=UPI0035ABE78E